MLFAFCMDCIDDWTMNWDTTFTFSCSPGKKISREIQFESWREEDLW